MNKGIQATDSFSSGSIILKKLSHDNFTSQVDKAQGKLKVCVGFSYSKQFPNFGRHKLVPYKFNPDTIYLEIAADPTG